MPLTVREATAADLTEVARLRWTWSEEGHAPIRGTLTEYGRDLVSWYEWNDRYVAYVAALDDQVVGMGFLAVVPRVPDPRSFERFTGDIQSVYVLEAHRGGGIGARLVEALVQHARESGCKRVTVHADQRAVSLYTRAGFTAESNLLLLPLT